MKKVLISLIIIFSLFAGVVVNASEYINIIGEKEVIFQITSEGLRSEINLDIRAYQARKKATRRAFFRFKNWIETLKFEDKLLTDLMEEDLELKKIVKDNLFKDFSLEEVKFPDGRVKVRYIRRWNGTELAQTLDKLYRQRSKELNKVLSDEENKVVEDTNSDDKYERSEDGKSEPATYKGYTGVIVDTRGLDINPSMAPKIFDRKGNEIYGTMEANTDYVIEVGIVGYAYNLKEAKTNLRTGSNPLIIKAVERKGNANEHAVISLENAKFLTKMSNNSSVFTKCKVMFIIDE